MNVAVVVPARFEASRFPGKLLVDLEGKSVLQHVYDALKSCSSIDALIIATDDRRIANAAEDYGATVQMTSPFHRSGTDRCAEVAASLEHIDIVINVQGDEPFIRAELIDEMVEAFNRDESTQILTYYNKVENVELIHEASSVKVVVDRNQRALYFSRCPIPYGKEKNGWNKHVGIYGFRKNVLLDIAKLKPSPLELSEKLEQLRWLENGYSIVALQTSYTSISIDVPEDLKAAREYFKEQQANA